MSNKNENINLYECFDTIPDPPKSFEKVCKKYWFNKHKPFEFIDGNYFEDSDGNLYFYHNGLTIRVSEHFAENGKTINKLIEDLIIYQAKQF